MSFRRWTLCNSSQGRANIHRKDSWYIHRGPPICHRLRFLCTIGKSIRVKCKMYTILGHSLERINIKKILITLNMKLIQKEGHPGPKSIRGHSSKKSRWKIFQLQVLFLSSIQYWWQRSRKQSANQTSLTFIIVSYHSIEIAVRSMVVVLSNQIINPNFNLESIQIHILIKLEVRVG